MGTGSRPSPSPQWPVLPHVLSQSSRCLEPTRLEHRSLNGQIMGDRKVRGFFASNDLRQVPKVTVVAAAKLFERDFLRTFLEVATWPIKRQGESGWFERPDIDRALVAADHELTPPTAIDFNQRGPKRCGGLGIFRHGETVVQ